MASSHRNEHAKFHNILAMATSMFDSDSNTQDFLGFTQADLDDSVNQNGEFDISFS